MRHKIHTKIRKVKGYIIEPYADLRKTDLRRADLRRADLHNTNLRGVNLEQAILQGADLQDADLQGANLRDADLRDADLQGANLRDADLRGADLRETNLSQTEGLLNSAEWLKRNFRFDEKGRLVVYKMFGDTYYRPPESWKIETGKIISETVNPCRTEKCGCGVNFATLEWIKNEMKYIYNKHKCISIRECYIEPADLADVVVPYNTKGKARCARLIIGKEVQITND